MSPLNSVELVSIERQREYHLACAEHADEYEAIRLQVLTEHSANFTNNIGGRWAIGHQTRLRFTAYIAERYGIHPPGRNPVEPREAVVSTVRVASLEGGHDTTTSPDPTDLPSRQGPCYNYPRAANNVQ